jgi:type IV pilus assembly protein PilE
MKTLLRSQRSATGFTLIEVMITVAVIAILAAVALPAYFDYITRSRLVEARANLADMRTRMEQYFLDNRAYPGECIASASGAAPAGKIYLPGNAKFFTYTCPVLSATAYTIRARDTFSPGAKFEFTVNEANLRQTTSVAPGWGTVPKDCWIVRKNDC